MTPADSSQILIRPADSSLYVRYKRAWQKVGTGAGTVTGSGTINRVPKWTSSTALGNSSIVDSASAVAMTINPSGNIGINFTSPTYRLDLRNDVPASTSLEPIALGLYNNNDGGSAIYFRNSVNGQSKIAFGVENTGAGTNDTYLGFSTGVDGTLNDRLRIIANGNVGINYTAPAARLAVNGTALINTNTDNGVDRLQVNGNVEIRGQTGNVTTPTYLKLDQSYSLTPAFNKLKIYFYVDAVESYGYGVGSNSDLQYWAGSSTTGMHRFYTKQTEAVRITANQSILINTTTDNNVDKLQVNGSIQGTGFNQAYLARTTTYTATTSDYFIDCTSGTFTVNLFTAVGNTGRILIIKNSGTGTITVDPNGSQTIDGATTQSLATQWSRIHIISDGANWKIISN